MLLKTMFASLSALTLLTVATSVVMANPLRYEDEGDYELEGDLNEVVEITPVEVTKVQATTATATVTKLTGLTSLAAGASREVWWNNSYSNAVYTINAVPVVLVGASGCAEVTRQWRTLASNPQEHEFHFTVKNCGTSTANIDLYLSTVR